MDFGLRIDHRVFLTFHPCFKSQQFAEKHHRSNFTTPP